MLDLDQEIYFSCNDCGQFAIPCSLRMILENAVFCCDSCGCQFHGAEFPGWLEHAVPLTGGDPAESAKIMAEVYSFIYNRGSIQDAVLTQLLGSDKDIWRMIPGERLARANLAGLLDNEEFVAGFDFSLLDHDGTFRLLLSRPDLAGKCSLDLEQLTGDDWRELVRTHPKFASSARWDKIFPVVAGKKDPAVAEKDARTIFTKFPYKNDPRFKLRSKKDAKTDPLFSPPDVFWAVVNYFRFGPYVNWKSFTPAELIFVFGKYHSLLAAYPFDGTNLFDFDWNSFSQADWDAVARADLLPEALTPVYQVRQGLNVTKCLKTAPKLDRFCNWQAMSGREWTSLLTAFPDKLEWVKKCRWTKLSASNWKQILSDRKNDYAISVHAVREGKDLVPILTKYPELEEVVNWDKVEIPVLLDALVHFPELIRHCPWLRLYNYITRLPDDRKKSISLVNRRLWNKRSELWNHVDRTQLFALSEEKYLTVMDFFDWEEFFDFSGLSDDRMVELFSKHLEFGKGFDWRRLSPGVKVRIAAKTPEFGRLYGWNNFTDKEICGILKRKPEYLGHFDPARFTDAFWQEAAISDIIEITVKNAEFGNLYGWDNFNDDQICAILNQKPEYLRYFESDRFSPELWKELVKGNDGKFGARCPLGFWNCLLFRDFGSPRIRTRISFRWSFFLSLIFFAANLYLLYDGPCGLRSFWAESHSRAITALAIYAGAAVLWSAINAWLFSGPTPFLTLLLSSMAGAGMVAFQYHYTFFCAKFTLVNYISAGFLLIAVILLAVIKMSSEGVLSADNEFGVVIIVMSYVAVILASFLFCHPYPFPGLLLRLSEQLKNSPRPFYAASRHYLEGSFERDRTVKPALAEFDQALKDGQYLTCRLALSKIPEHYREVGAVQEREAQLREALERQ